MACTKRHIGYSFIFHFTSYGQLAVWYFSRGSSYPYIKGLMGKLQAVLLELIKLIIDIYYF